MDLGRIFRKKSSREIAKDRLKILLISDRVNCSPEMMEMIKTDIAKVKLTHKAWKYKLRKPG